MSLKTTLEFIENKADVLRANYAKPDELQKWFIGGALVGAFGLVAGVPIAVTTATTMLAAPTSAYGALSFVKWIAKRLSRYTH
jgi:hypothetical protein